MVRIDRRVAVPAARGLMSGAGRSRTRCRATAARLPDKAAVITAQRTLSYRELDEGADRVASWVAATGMERGDRVAVELPEQRRRCRGDPRGAAVGAAITLISPAIKRDKLAYILADCGARR